MMRFFRRLSGRQETANKPKDVAFHGHELLPASPVSLQSQLLNDILDKSSPPSSGEVPRQAPPSPQSHTLNVGTILGDAKEKIVAETQRLAAVVDDRTWKLLDASLGILRHKACRIAFVGQMNAGKSSLINALVEQGELLPADINPWTTVVTNLRFGVPDEPKSGALFTFFTAHEWKRLSAGGRVRELTERVFPNFDWSKLNDQVEAMQQRAEKKLGSRFQSLLGSKHEFSSVTHNVLNKYVGAGAPEPEGDNASTGGEFSDVTKVADVFFDFGPFSFPTIIIDTPGVNDPFLVRDEITRQNLELTDICVIVLTARQPLSSADLNLLRMLRGLNKSRLVVFINKVDEIEADRSVVRDVTHRVKAVLKDELPSANIPIILGSARWARLARTGAAPNAAAPDKSDSPKDERAARESADDWLTSSFWDSVNSENLFFKSGLPGLALAISELMKDGPIAESIAQTASFVQAVCVNTLVYATVEFDLLSVAENNVSSIKQHVTMLQDVGISLEEVFSQTEKQLRDFCTGQRELLHQKLLGAVCDSAREQGGEFLTKRDQAKINQADLRMRLRLEAVFLDAFEKASQAVLAQKHVLHREIERHLSFYGLREKLHLESTRGAVHGNLPSMSALSEPASISLVTTFNELCLTPRPPEEIEGLLTDLILADFKPIIAKLADDAETELNAQSLSLLQDIRLLALHPLQIMLARLSNTLEEIWPAEGSENGGAKEIQHILEENVQAIQSRIDTLNGVISALKATSLKLASAY